MANISDFIITYRKTSMPCPWYPENYNSYKVFISKDGKSVSYDYWDGLQRKNTLDIQSAFDCYISEIIAGNDSFNDFCEIYGYNNDSINDHKIWSTARRRLNNFMRTFNLTIDEIMGLKEEEEEQI